MAAPVKCHVELFHHRFTGRVAGFRGSRFAHIIPRFRQLPVCFIVGLAVSSSPTLAQGSAARGMQRNL